ncbi:uncharacterized protein Z520_03870 [Fonsecaea multimorphosa CBS 102226]|uniref:TeaA receptor TeaR n=1 Tax=Fonsecaea multimorphosa CBS 102226 TaxID=1442371 RepID=A0A0D2KAI4_9EURO|nr:uncharacterized protein Z520_03870 [Fonsecaea multimorphosa CBS 102226]KIY00185.1 hypothetical protein Z520_03870 [Fonsecaea multimorphosa CBS 102226]OAL27380.1 hypothetical protein AYO22_03655 [Fonsecaea multimorphosa]
MVVNGARPPYDAAGSASQENTTANKSRPGGSLRQSSSGSTRTPLSALAPNRKDSTGVNGGRPVPHSRVEELGQRETSLIRSGSEADSLLDLYKSNPSSGNVSQNHAADNDIPENMYRPAEDDPEGWIHRDKLAKIESEELQAAGINLAKARRNTTKSTQRDTSRGRRSEDRNNPSEYRRVESEETKTRLPEPLPEAEEDERANWDFRTPEEIAADNASSQLYLSPTLRKSGSKIPVLTSSPLPIPQERIERDTPLVRKRTISNSMSPEDGLPVLKTRTRKGSIGSQTMQDEGDSALLTTPVPHKQLTYKTSSPTKSRPKTAQGSPPGTSAGRKTSATTRKPSNAKPGAAPSTNQRPGTRSGELDRPRTAVNRPEGDPPWLATMYKPDPRLPPEEQIIPTHARRQQQAQWEDQGAVPTTYDRNFSPLAIHTGNGQMKLPSPVIPQSAQPGEKETDGTDGGNGWPLKPGPNVRNSGAGSMRPSTGGSMNGGYSTMPRVSNPVTSPGMGSITSVPTQPNTRMQVQRVQQDDMEEKVKEKGCGCCVVM